MYEGPQGLTQREHDLDVGSKPIEFQDGTLHLWDREGDMHVYDEWAAFAVTKEEN